MEGGGGRELCGLMSVAAAAAPNQEVGGDMTPLQLCREPTAMCWW